MKAPLIMAAAVALLVAAESAMAQPTPAGDEFQVSASPGYNAMLAGEPAVSMVPSGGFVVAWRDGYPSDAVSRLLGRRFDSAGNPLSDIPLLIEGLHVERSYPPPDPPSIAAHESGGFVVVWSGAARYGLPFSIYGRRFSRTGRPLGKRFRVSSPITGDEDGAFVAMDRSGRFVVVWRTDVYGYPSSRIFARRFDSSGAPLDANPVEVATNTTHGHFSPSVSMDGSGGFTAVWRSHRAGTFDGVVGRRFDRSGAPLDPQEFVIAADPTVSHEHPRVAASARAGFAVVWAEWWDRQDLSAGDVFVRRFDGAARPLDPQAFVVNTNTMNGQANPSVAADESGNFVVVWESFVPSLDPERITGRRFDSTGTAVDQVEFEVSSDSLGNERAPAVAADASGNFVVAWKNPLQGFIGSGVMARRFLCDDLDADDLCEWDEVVLTAPLDGSDLDCSDPSSIRPTISWGAGNYDRFRVHLSPDPAFPAAARVTSGDELLSTTSWMPSPKRWRAACAKALAASPDEPVLYVRVLGKDKDLREGDPRRLTFSRTIQVSVHP